MKPYLSIIVPVYNEEKAVKKTILKIKKVMKKTKKSFELIVVDDGSTDNSSKILNKLKGIKIIKHHENRGYGSALKTGIRESKGKFILITDADGTYPIKSIPSLIKHTNEYDMVVGARTGKNVNIPLLRRPAKKILSLLANFLTREKIPDLNSGLRIFKKNLAMSFFNLFPSGFSFTTTITLCALTNNYRIKYIPINYKKRVGKSSIKPSDFFSFIKLVFKIMLFFEPLKFFLAPGLIFILGGTTYGIYQIINYETGLGQLPIILILGGSQICFLGILAELIVKRIRYY